MEGDQGEFEDEPMGAEEEVLTAAEEDLKSPKIPEYSHLPPDPMDADKSEGKNMKYLLAVNNKKINTLTKVWSRSEMNFIH